ncbi:BTAD domain-containing putative transcriptional regulator [Pseudarthrobacter sp. NPDC080039]|uniref:AfsR/SARP family transcriptional regulator n=1 Tax=unclassified Pseudarthrobacter TaxID=2647000 RepID=UPI00344B3DCD
MKEVDFQVLGKFAVAVDGKLVPGDAWRSRRAADVLKLLVLSPDVRLHRSQVMEALWPESSPQASGTNLRKALYFVRRATADAQAVVSHQGVLVLWPGAQVHSDVEGFEGAARQALAAGNLSACRAAANLYYGELLPDDRYESWLGEPRQRLRQLYLDLLRVGEMWQRLFDEDPTDEQAARALMRAHLNAGERREAIRRFERLRGALRDHLGVGPDRSTIALYEDVLSAEGALQPTQAERAHALLAWALVHLNRNDLKEAERAAEEARSIALDSSLGRELGEAAVILAKVATAQGRWRERFAEELGESMRMRANMEPIVYDAHLCLAEYHLAGPDGYAIAADFARQMMRIAAEAGSGSGAALGQLMLGEAELLAGHLTEAQKDLSQAAEANDREGCLSGSALSRQRLAEVALIGGRKFDANRLLSRARSFAVRSELATHLLVRVFGTMIQAAADSKKALAVVRLADRDLSAMRSCEPCSMGYLTSAAAACARAGELDQAHSFLSRAEGIAGMWQGGLWSGAVWEARGILRQAEGADEQSWAMFREAAHEYIRAGSQPDADRCLEAAASPHRRSTPFG